MANSCTEFSREETGSVCIGVVLPMIDSLFSFGASLRRGLLLLLVATLGAALPGFAQTARPNLVIIMTDDLGYGDVGAYGGRTVPTPHIDRLAARGVRFTDGYATSATCTPSRYALFTGEYGWRKPPRQTGILAGDAPLAIDVESPTLPKMLRAVGYRTGLVGKWHLGVGDGTKPVDFNGRIAPGPLEVGFDEAFFIPATVDRVPCVFIENHRVHGLDPADPIRVSYGERIGTDPTGTDSQENLKMGADRQHSDTVINGISRIGHMSGGKAARWVDEDIADVLVQRSRAFIAQHKARPFFLFLGTHDPHVPRAPHPRFRGKSDSGIRGDTIAQIDWLVGEVVGELERQGVADNTLIVFTSDNGPVLFDGYFDGAEESVGAHRPRGPLRGYKYEPYEGATRVPFIVSWPAQIKPGVSKKLISQIDLFASVATLTGGTPPPAGTDSFDLLPTLLGESGGRERPFIVQQDGANDLSLRVGKWKFIPAPRVAGPAPAATAFTNTRDPRAARRADNAARPAALYDLERDLGETTNVIAAHSEKAAELAAMLEAIRAGKRF